MSISIKTIPTTLPIAVLGLGAIGYAIAGHLAKAGNLVTVCNRTESKALEWVKEYGGKRAAFPIDAAWKSKIVFSCVSDDEALRAVTLGKSGAFAGMKPGTLFVDHSHTCPDLAKELAAQAHQFDIFYIDAPVLGTSADAQKRTLSVIAGTTPAIFERLKPFIQHYATSITLAGPVGSGQQARINR